VDHLPFKYITTWHGVICLRTYRQLVRVLQEDSPGIPLYNPLHTVGLRRHVALPPGAHTAGEFVWFWKMDVA
jgi:hypothetical protein